ncbi:MAG: DUF2911 domain-containing protein [Flammeovirgaceae bacterium]
MQLKRLFGLTLVILLATGLNAFAQKKQLSPPMESSATINGVNVKINYGAPSVRGRAIWGTKIVKYDEVWRTGANEASTIEVSKDVLIEGKKLKAGKYGLFTIPRANGKWTIVFNSVANQWGAYNYDSKKDVLRVDVKASSTTENTEQMKIDIADNGKVTIMWEKVMVPFTISVK